jgi:excinuclease ABC subunit C
MSLAAKQKRFEDAARFRDQISALSAIQESGPDAGLNEVEDLKRLLKLDKLPRRIEGFDISNISGKLAVGSMVSFYDGLPDKNNYRRFKIKTVFKVDDYKMMAEVVYRRYLRLINEKRPLPDLVLIDGGRQHLAVADNEMRNLGLKLTVISIAKEKENIYLQDKVLPLRYRPGAPALNLIRRVRDEAHRFAVSYHHLLRRKNILGK